MRQYSKGFTLVELVIVIAIIGILAGIAIPYYTDAQATARGARIVADMTTIQEAYTVYLVKNGMAEKEINTSHGYYTYAGKRRIFGSNSSSTGRKSNFC